MLTTRILDNPSAESGEEIGGDLRRFPEKESVGLEEFAT